jgi:hypothetical protein
MQANCARRSLAARGVAIFPGFVRDDAIASTTEGALAFERPGNAYFTCP